MKALAEFWTLMGDNTIEIKEKNIELLSSTKEVEEVKNVEETQTETHVNGVKQCEVNKVK